MIKSPIGVIAKKTKERGRREKRVWGRRRVYGFMREVLAKTLGLYQLPNLSYGQKPKNGRNGGEKEQNGSEKGKRG